MGSRTSQFDLTRADWARVTLFSSGERSLIELECKACFARSKHSGAVPSRCVSCGSGAQADWHRHRNQRR